MWVTYDASLLSRLSEDLGWTDNTEIPEAKPRGWARNLEL